MILELNCLPHKSWTVMEDTVTFLDEENNLMMEVRERLMVLEPRETFLSESCQSSTEVI